MIVYDDLSRLIRGTEANRLLGIGVDNGTRTICIADGIDTADDTWEEDAINACSENVAHIERASRRIKQKCMNRFKKYGIVPKRPITGYIVPPDATSLDEWQKDESLAAIIREGADRLRRTLNCSAVAAWFNEIGFPPGRYSRIGRWTGAKVRHYYANPLFKGMPQRGQMHSRKHHGTGRRRSVKNPKGPTYYEAPHLAHLTPAEFDDLNAALKEHNANFRRRGVNGKDTRSGVSRKRTRFPGQHAACWYCGRPMVWGGNGMSENLMCSGAREWRCWNAVGFNGALAATRTIEVILPELRALEEFDAQFREMVESADYEMTTGLAPRWDALRRGEAELKADGENIKAAVRRNGQHPLLEETLAELDQRRAQLARERHELERLGSKKPVLPQSVAELRKMLEEELEKRAVDSPECGDLLRQLVPEFHVYVVRSCDGGHPLPRARLKLDLAGSIADAALVPGMKELLTRVVTIDVFEPCQREQIRMESVRLATEGLTHKQIAARLPDNPTSTAVSNAIALHKTMLSLGLHSPYVILLEPPADYPKLRRHRNSKFRPEPLDGYQRPQL